MALNWDRVAWVALVFLIIVGLVLYLVLSNTHSEEEKAEEKAELEKKKAEKEEKQAEELATAKVIAEEDRCTDEKKASGGCSGQYCGPGLEC